MSGSKDGREGGKKSVRSHKFDIVDHAAERAEANFIQDDESRAEDLIQQNMSLSLLIT